MVRVVLLGGRDHRERPRSVERTLMAQGSDEGTAPDREVEARRGGMHIGTPSRLSRTGIGSEDTVDHDTAQQGSLGFPGPAPHTGADRLGSSDHR